MDRSTKLQRIAFQLRLKQGAESAYDEAHRRVWPELLTALQEGGVREYSIFRRGQELFLYMLVPSFDDLMERLSRSAVNIRWQQTMAPLFEPVPSLRPGEPFAMMQEVFYMQGAPAPERRLPPTQENSHEG